MKISKDLNAATARALVLGMLQDGESYGYALIQRVKELSGGTVEWTEGTLYPVLHRLEAEGLIRARWGESEAGRRRKYYRLTPQAVPAMKEDRRQWEAMHGVLSQLWKLRHA